MLTGPRSDSETAGQAGVQLRWPETGGIKFLLEVALLYYLVLVAMPMLRAQIVLLNPAIVPEPFTTGMYALLVAGAGVILVWMYRSESLMSARQFDTPIALEKALAHELLGQRWAVMYSGCVILGGSLAWVTYDRFVKTYLHVVDALVIVPGEFEWMISITDAVSVVGFLGGFILFATGVDRLVVDGLRRYIRRRQVSG